MENLKQTVKELNEKYSYLTDEKFTSILRCAGKFSENEIKEYRKFVGKGVAYLIENAPVEVIQVILDANIDNTYKRITFENDNYTSKYFVKVIFRNKKSNAFTWQEIDLCTYNGNKILVSLHENNDIEIIATCRMTDEISNGKDYHKIYEGDIISTQGHNWNDRDKQLIMAFLDGSYIGGDPMYRELLWTDKYGYLAPNKEKPNMDNTPLLLSESSFNCKGGRYNYHKITCQGSFKLIGNINTHYDLLKP